MLGATREVALRDLGIVGMEEALEDGAAGAAEAGRRCVANDVRQDVSVLSEHYWCTLCRKCLRRRAAYRHRSLHSSEWGELLDPAKVQEIQQTLDQLYGVLVPHALLCLYFSRYVRGAKGAAGVYVLVRAIAQIYVLHEIAEWVPVGTTICSYCHE
jgi:hypothetical protein